ncbi:alkaline/neutral invertase E, chloroplastic-like [Arachis hypogaea]|uniref:alkaline/neutral invertase E, chloroplastic-like n=1 Tax=Arachis hypogaea TaxID=3818 RepID=UPI003B224C5C
MRKVNEIYRYKTQEYSYDAVNEFNIYPEQIPPWLVEFMPSKGGYLIGNLQLAHMGFRFFSLGNLWSIVSSLATAEQSHAILDLIEAKWAELVADMPFKICYPALNGQEWRIIAGSDPKNTYAIPHYSIQYTIYATLICQPMGLVYLLVTVACIKMNRADIASKAVQVAERRISKDKWPEYYDTKRARFIGKQARLFQTWSIAGYLVAKQLLANPDAAKFLINEEDPELINALSCMISANPRRRKRGRKKQSFIV